MVPGALVHDLRTWLLGGLAIEEAGVYQEITFAGCSGETFVHDCTIGAG
jgi:hypothetical protein